jgi:type I restriction enzyme M protein
MRRRNLPAANHSLSQITLWDAEDFLPRNLPVLGDLQPAYDLQSILEDCHNYIYANEGMLREKAFRELVKILSIKILDERLAPLHSVRFGITAEEYKAVKEGRASSFLERMDRLYGELRSAYGDFFSDSRLHLSAMTLAYIVQRLQHISLERTPADVKGELFQTFVTRYQRGDRGEFFTPYPVVELAVQMIAPTSNERIVDPACGSGSFLLHAARYVAEQNDISINDYIENRLLGIEFNPEVAWIAQLRFALAGAQGCQILCANALERGLTMESEFDIVLANPPFGSRGKIDDPSILSRYETGRRWVRRGAHEWQRTDELLSGQTPEVLFLELCIRLLRSGGRMAVVIPDGILQNSTTEYLRYWLRSQARVLAVVSLPQVTFVPYGTGIKTSLLLAQKNPSEVRRIFMAIPERIGYDVKGQPIYKRDWDESASRVGATLRVDTDLPEVAMLYKRLQHGDTDWTSPIAFWLDESVLNHRFDAEHYQPHDAYMLSQLSQYLVYPLGDLADIVDRGEDFRGKNVMIDYIAIADVSPQLMLVVSKQRMHASEAPSRARYRVRAGDIITAVSGASTGTENHATAFITEDEDGAICTSGFAVLRNFRKVEPLYLLAFMRTEFFHRQVRRLLRGHAIPAITLEDLATIQVPVPPQDIQQAIASKVRETIRHTKQGLAQLNDAKLAIENLFPPMDTP